MNASGEGETPTSALSLDTDTDTAAEGRDAKATVYVPEAPSATVVVRPAENTSPGAVTVAVPGAPSPPVFTARTSNS